MYKPSTKQCWNVTGFDAVQVKDANYDSYYKSYIYSLKAGLDQSGKTINPPGGLNNIDVDTCKSICDRNPACKGIVYKPSAKQCWTVNGFDAVQVKNAAYDSYHKSNVQVKYVEGYTSPPAANDDRFIGIW